ncbi:hypothetical protein TPHA_0G03090 [Tetrapisispora phaffii CBS 4417]|uniref:DNA replication regulator SLD2 n=1 Tax=Tetrapisispora phaffii (strain ATCC 24235 / CBS 4417 / NBRC 1672 / NRRL Y-8282 / UCD 70-5) TaxID=1071381 RepID=G8BW72_TETPH|nr:hypothetical protein TPHA_0G03090 [Tetrapisispora phaffii CBS 4417]CCE64150.1 hypothetical protein TPHA_0G03090 [Tetrapisispora phaffii CBS 4417]
MSISELKIHIKTWEHQFIQKHDRAPTKEDIKTLPDIKQLYKKYSSLKKGATSEKEHKETGHHNFNSNDILSRNVTSNHEEITEIDNNRNIFASPIRKIKQEDETFGPTPQIFGKAISIFDMKISPIKQISLTNIEISTPSNLSPASTISASSPNSYSRENSTVSDVTIKRRLQFNITPISSPNKNSDLVPDRDTEISMGNSIEKNRLHPPKTLHLKYGPNSPLKLEDQNVKIKLRRTPIRRTTSQYKRNLESKDSFSPSPLLKRPLTKSILELAQEHEAIVEEFTQLNEQLRKEKTEVEPSTNGYISDNIDEEMISQTGIRDIFNEDTEEVSKSKTVKVKRRRVIRRYEQATNDKNAIPLNLHKELIKLKKEQVKGYMSNENDSEDNSNSDDNSELIESGETDKSLAGSKTKPKRKRPKKYNLVSNNFRRLKLPRKNKFKGRWGGRR